MPEKTVFDRYLLALRKTKIDEKTEHTDRAALQILLQAFADESSNPTAVQHEPKRVADKGAPDFKITSRGLILGYVENKAIGEHLDKVLKSDQIARYKTLSQNIILTDYLHFIWISKDGIQRETLCHVTDLENPRFRLCSQSQWSYARSKAELPSVNLDKATVEIVYRPFDNRWTIWDRNVAVHRRERVMQHMLQSNLALLTARSNKSSNPDHFFVSEMPSETKAAESTIQSYSFPLFAYINGKRRENLGPDFRAYLDAKYDHHYTPEEILGYVYGVVNAPSYRKSYTEFLRNDFPRVPFPESANEFEALSGLGWALVQAHLLHELPRRRLAGYHGKGDHTVEIVRYSPEEQTISINKTQFFKPVPEAVWELHIGGYQVLDKYLRAGLKKKLSDFSQL